MQGLFYFQEIIGLARIVDLENFHALLKHIVLMILDERCADSQAFLLRTTGNQTDGRNTIVHQFLGQLTRRHTWIANGKIEAISNGLVQILIVNHIEVVATENLLYLTS